MTLRLERSVGKRRILEIYLNIAEFGLGLYGIGPASKFYFGKSPSELNAKEGAFLAMLLPSPKRYSISFRKKQLTGYAAGIVRSILEKLLATNRISEGEFQAYLNMPLSFETVAAPLPPPEQKPPGDEEVVL